MNREIKYRAWDKKINKFHPSGTVYLTDDGKPFQLEVLSKKDTEESIFKIRFLNEMNIVFFTGLKDRNGKEIYEGDILERPISEDKDLLRVPVKFVTSGYNAFFDFGSLPQPSKCEIVGNIFENLELLDF